MKIPLVGRSFAVFLLWTSAALLHAQSVGVAVNGTCDAGVCPGGILPEGASVTLPLAVNYTFPNGDKFLIGGSLGNNSTGAGQELIVTIAIQVTYQGNTNGAAAPSAADTMTLDLTEGFQSGFATGNFGSSLIGTFSSNIATGSTAAVCWAQQASCLGPVSPPGPFNQSGGFSLTNTNGTFPFEENYTLVFGAGSPAGSYIVLGESSGVPSISGVVDAAAFTTNMQPGELASIFGTFLTNGNIQSAATLPLPDQLVDATVTVNGIPAPLLYASPTQINFQIPFEAPLATAQVVVTTSAGASAPFSIPIQSTEISLFQYNGNEAVVENADYSLNGSGNGAAPGSYLIAFATGGGPVSNPPADGSPAVAKPLSSVTGIPLATINGESAPVSFAGLTPEFVGLLQMNISVPSDLAAGTYNLLVSVNGVAGPPATVVIR